MARTARKNYRAIFPVLERYLEPEIVLSGQEQIRKELDEHSLQVKCLAFNRVVHNVEFSTANHVPKHISNMILEENKRYIARPRFFVQFTSNNDFESHFPGFRSELLKEQNYKYREDEIKQLWEHTLGHVVCESVEPIVVLTNIAKPGALVLGVGLALHGNEVLFRHETSSHDFSGAFELCERENLPLLQLLSLRDVFAWGHRVRGFFSGLPKSNVGRALCYFSHLFGRIEHLDSISELMHALGGLEAALYGLQRQSPTALAANFVEFVGLPELRKRLIKMIERMYEFRSDFLHGRWSLAAAFLHDVDWSDRPSIHSHASEAIYLAKLLLLAFVQRAACEHIVGSRFEQVLKKEMGDGAG